MPAVQKRQEGSSPKPSGNVARVIGGSKSSGKTGLSSSKSFKGKAEEGNEQTDRTTAKVLEEEEVSASIMPLASDPVIEC